MPPLSCNKGGIYNMNDYEIRRAQIKDWPTLLSVFDKSLRSIEEYEAHSEDDYSKLYQCLMNHSFPLYDIYTYVVNDEILGFICYFTILLSMNSACFRFHKKSEIFIYFCFVFSY